MRAGLLLSLCVVFTAVVSCSGSGATRKAKPDRFTENSPCMQSLHETLEQFKGSQRMHCTKDADCALVTNPATPEPRFKLAVHGTDAARLDRRAKQHLERCGTFQQTGDKEVKRQVKAKQFQIYDLHVLQGWEVKRVAATLKISAAQVYLAKQRVGRMMKKAIQAIESQEA